MAQTLSKLRSHGPEESLRTSSYRHCILCLNISASIHPLDCDVYLDRRLGKYLKHRETLETPIYYISSFLRSRCICTVGGSNATFVLLTGSSEDRTPNFIKQTTSGIWALWGLPPSKLFYFRRTLNFHYLRTNQQNPLE